MRRIPDAGASSHGADRGGSDLSRQDVLNEVLAVAGVGFCRLDATLRPQVVDSRFKTLFGLAQDAEPGWADIEAAIAAEERPALLEALRVALAGEAPLDTTLGTIGSVADGIRWVALRGRLSGESSCAEQGHHSKPRELLLVARDATAERLALNVVNEQVAIERRARVSAEIANRAKDEFLSVISHELRSPLNAILGWNRILAIKRPDDVEVNAVAPRIEQSARAQLKIVNDLMDLGRIGTGKLRLTPRQMRLSPLIGVAIDAVRPSAAAKSIEIVADVQAQRAPILGDPDRLNQVVANLLSNAIKFTPEGGRITVRLQEVDARIVLSVEDTGQGIAADLLPHVFDRFRQGDSSTTRGAGGLGLGLTLVREIISLHGGTVSASSDGQNRGSVFVVALPTASLDSLLAPSAEGKKTSHSHAQQLVGLSILVVDDEADARAVVAETLRLEGATVTVGESAHAALEHLLTPGTRFDVLVTDIGMPEEDGYSLVRKTRKMLKGERLVAIALTGYASRSDVDAAIDAGFDMHVPKPVDFDSFVPTIRRLADTRR